MEPIDTANQLKAEIDDLKRFIYAVDANQITRGSGRKDINVLFKVTTAKSISIFGSRSFGIGSHKAEIEVPDMLLSEVSKQAKALLGNKENELNNLFKI